MRLLGGWMRVPQVEAIADGPLLSIIVPARDEERNIERCVRSLVAQRGIDVGSRHAQDEQQRTNGEKKPHAKESSTDYESEPVVPWRFRPHFNCFLM